MKQLRKYKIEIAGLVTGAIAGWCYWFFIGCADGHCKITSSPTISTAYGAVMGALLFSILKRK
jgi:hypothetical protein